MDYVDYVDSLLHFVAYGTAQVPPGRVWDVQVDQ